MIPRRYVPRTLSKKDKDKQIKMLKQSRQAYRRGQYLTRKRLPSYPHRVSPHILTAQREYGVDTIGATRELSTKTGCSVSALRQIIRKGAGAYFSAGSRPSQTAQSWGIARLASALTGGKAGAVDFSILEKGCDHKGKGFRFAQQSRKKHGHGRRHTPRIAI